MFRRIAKSEKRQEVPGMSGRTFLYHAHGLALGGTNTQPFKAEIESHAATSLPIVGGFASAKMESYRLREIVSYSSAHSYVSGIQTDDGTYTVASSSIEGLNILDVITADAIVGRLSAKHSESGQPEIITLGSTFVNLKIGGQLVQVDLDNDLYTAHPTFEKLVSHFDPQGKQAKAATKAKSPAKFRYAGGAIKRPAVTATGKGYADTNRGGLAPCQRGFAHQPGETSSACGVNQFGRGAALRVRDSNSSRRPRLSGRTVRLGGQQAP